MEMNKQRIIMTVIEIVQFILIKGWRELISSRMILFVAKG